MGLAKRYFAEAPNRDFLFDQTKSISLLQPPPSWGLAPTMPADWVLKQRLRESRGMKGTNRRDRRSRSRSKSRRQETDVSDQVEIDKYLDDKQKTLAVIACGYGPGEDDEERYRKRRKMLMCGAVAVALVAVSYTVLMQNRSSGSNAVGSHGDSSRNTERDFLETRGARRVKSAALTAETRTQSEEMKGDSPLTLRTTSENLSKPLGEIMSTPGITKISKEEATKVVASQRKLAESTRIQPSVLAETVMKHNSSLLSRSLAVSSHSTFVKPASSVTVPAPLRFMKDILLKIRHFAHESSVEQVHGALKNFFRSICQLVKGIDIVPGTLSVQGVYNDLQYAVDEREPIVVPGAGFLRDFVSKGRNIIASREGARFLKGIFSDARNVLSARKARCLVQDFVRNTEYFLSNKNGQGARLVKAAVDNARAALVDNEAQVVVL